MNTCPSVSGAALNDGYESLRAQATGQAMNGAAPRGMALFMRSGLAAWVVGWMHLVAASAPAPRAPRSEQAAPMTELSTLLVMVLTEMALAGQRRCQA
jgi:hypothetical protein